MSVYLIHFETRYQHARHYIGFAVDLKNRIKHHRQNTGAHLLKIVNLAGINWEVARVWPDGDKKFERSLKNKKNSKAYCPLCRQEKRKDLDK